VSLRIKSGTVNFTSPQVGTVGFNTFWLGTALDQTFEADTISVWEGWYFTNNHYFASKVKCTGSNSIKFNQDEFVSSQVILDGALNTQISNCYFDRQAIADDGVPLLRITCNFRTSLGLQINNNQFNSQGNPGDCILLDGTTNGAGSQLTAVTISNNYYAGIPSHNINTQANGIVIKGGVSCISILGERMFNFYSCIKLLDGAVLLRSIIQGLDARDADYYALGFTPENIAGTECSCIYKVMFCELTIPTYLASANEEVVGSYTIPNADMIMNPVITRDQITASRPEFYPYVSQYDKKSVNFKCVKRIPAPGGERVKVTARVILDGTRITGR
jgi:hypothetical protein